MDYRDINPFLRFVNTIKFVPIQKNFRAADNHFYYSLEEGYAIHINGERYELGIGSVVIVPSGEEYFFEYDGKLRIVSINFDYTQSNREKEAVMPPKNSEDFDENEILEKTNFDNCAFLNNPIVINNVSYLKPKIDAILEEYAYKKQFYREMASLNLKNILFEILRHCLWGEKNNHSINTILEYIHNHYGEEINNTVLSELVGYHPYHLNRLMKSSTGTTLRQYLINYRIETAKKLLRETDMRISEIAEKCGYKNFCNFSEDFKHKTGLSPKKYRSELVHMS